MATNTDAVNPINVHPAAPGQPAPAATTNEIATPPDARNVAANSMMPNLPPSGPTSTSLSSITAALGYNTFQPTTHGTSFFVPYFGFLSLMLSALDRVMLNTYRFNQSNPDWHPLFTQIYYGIIFTVHTIRVRRTAGSISMHENDFLTWFESNFPLSSLPVAGPVKHFLQSITVCTGPSKYHGNVIPYLPNDWTQSAAHQFAFPAALNYLNATMPMIPFLMDRLNDINRGATAGWIAQDWERYHTAGITHAYGVPLANAFPFGFAGVTDLQSLPAQSMVTFRAALGNLSIPPRLAAAQGNLTSIAEYCCLARHGVVHSLWFPVVVGMMQRHAQFVKDSTNLASISTVGLGATIPVIRFSANLNLGLANPAAGNVVYPTAAQPAVVGPPALVAQPAGFNAHRFTHLRISASSKRFDLHLIAEQFALLSCVNVDFTNIGARGNHYDPVPLVAQSRTGPMWDYPDVKSHVEVDVLGQYVLFLVGAFHTDQRMTR
jgi:hypothetical protein